MHVITEVLPYDDDVISLYASADCFISLHRSEGLGLGMMEAMLLGKPVIATGWSGNLDFMTADNSRLVEVARAGCDRQQPLCGLRGAGGCLGLIHRSPQRPITCGR